MGGKEYSGTRRSYLPHPLTITDYTSSCSVRWLLRALAAACVPGHKCLGVLIRFALCCFDVQEAVSYKGAWPQRLYLGMGGKEYSGTCFP